MSRATDQLALTIMVMTETEQHALAAALDHQSGRHDEVRMRSFYSALCLVVEESSAVAKVRSSSLPSIIDPFEV
jgi:hypothetical protein